MTSYTLYIVSQKIVLQKHDQAVIHDYNVIDDIYKRGDDDYYTVADFVDNTEGKVAVYLYRSGY